jgi:hypothetical protein
MPGLRHIGMPSPSFHAGIYLAVVLQIATKELFFAAAACALLLKVRYIPVDELRPVAEGPLEFNMAFAIPAQPKKSYLGFAASSTTLATDSGQTTSRFLRGFNINSGVALGDSSHLPAQLMAKVIVVIQQDKRRFKLNHTWSHQDRMTWLHLNYSII